MRSVCKTFSVTYVQNGPRRRVEDNIKLDLKCYKDVVWVYLVPCESCCGEVKEQLVSVTG